jgi:hypothetical protein
MTTSSFSFSFSIAITICTVRIDFVFLLVFAALGWFVLVLRTGIDSDRWS